MVKISSLLVLFGTAIVSVAAQRCGSQGGNTVCAAGNCCSQYGWCDTTAAHCDPANCQPNFSGAGSSCAKKITSVASSSSRPATSVTPAASTSTGLGNTVPHIDVCGSGSGGVSCPGAGFGGYFYRCCSKNGHCGPKNSEQASSDYCGEGCQPGYGKCDPARPVPPTPTAAPGIAQADENCGPIVNKKCANGLCCSGSNYCGTGTDYCGAANWCQVNWGTCHR